MHAITHLKCIIKPQNWDSLYSYVVFCQDIAIYIHMYSLNHLHAIYSHIIYRYIMYVYVYMYVYHTYMMKIKIIVKVTWVSNCSKCLLHLVVWSRALPLWPTEYRAWPFLFTEDVSLPLTPPPCSTASTHTTPPFYIWHS